MSDPRQRFSALRLACLLSLVVLTGGLASCHAVSSDEEPAVAAEPREVVINADSIAKLAPGEKLVIDRSADTAYTFDFAAAPIDFSRIVLRMENGQELAMDRWLSSSEYGAKLLASPNRVFRLAGKKQNLEGLTSLKDRNVKLFQQNALVCTYVVVVIEVVACNETECVVVIIEMVIEECYDDGTEP